MKKCAIPKCKNPAQVELAYAPRWIPDVEHVCATCASEWIMKCAVSPELMGVEPSVRRLTEGERSACVN